MTEQLKEYLAQIILELEKNGPIEIHDGYARMSGVPSIEMGFVERLIGGGWLVARISSAPLEQVGKFGKPGHGGWLIVVTAPGPAWWDCKQRQNAEFLATEMHLLAGNNTNLQRALSEAGQRFSRMQCALSWAALLVSVASFALSAVAIGLSQGWW